MDQRQRTKRFGLYVILCALLLRLSLSGLPGRAAEFLAQIPFPIYAETGRNVRFSLSLEDISPHVRESPPPWQPEPVKPVFAPDEAAETENEAGVAPDLEALLELPLSWDLTGPEPAVLILHTHTTESYTRQKERYAETVRYRTLEEDYNMLRVGDALAEVLREGGVQVIQDRQIHDYPSYNGAYVHARTASAQLLEENPSIRLVLDLHRDALEREGKQLALQVSTGGKTAARLMLVVGTGAGGATHPDWQENLSLALKLQAQLERIAPGIMRPVNLRRERFNQDLSPGALLVEVGAAGNTLEEALTAVRILGQGILALARGTGKAP